MNTATTAPRQHEIERYYFETFRKAYSLMVTSLTSS
jgi:hypothetical protein